MRYPVIYRHVGERGRAPEKTVVGRQEQQAGGRNQGDNQQDIAGVHPAPDRPVGKDSAEDHGIQGLSCNRFRFPQQVQQDDAAGGEGK